MGRLTSSVAVFLALALVAPQAAHGCSDDGGPATCTNVDGRLQDLGIAVETQT